MNKFIYLLPLVLSLFCIGVSHALSPDDAALFITGFASGVAVETKENVTQCVVDANVTLDSFDTGFTEIGEGLRRLDGPLVEQGLRDVGTGTQEAAKALQVCGVDKIGEDIAEIGKEIAEGKIIDVIGKTYIDILYHERTIRADIDAASTAWKEGNYEVSGKYYGQVVALILVDWNNP
eukprot:Phypoly_transcript_21522.p1 GENE.Phypoly_transcript_21522~~Phypoly_transcript_21522.p1  ORF type:complete len:199 (+),score=32.29 Phypoly_transcript_21522:66-599(+)